jgi:hypothetical protein
MVQRNSGYALVDDENYWTPDWVTSELNKVEKIAGPIWECAPGGGNMVSALRTMGHDVITA